jgi:hypothetical protein
MLNKLRLSLAVTLLALAAGSAVDSASAGLGTIDYTSRSFSWPDYWGP